MDSKTSAGLRPPTTKKRRRIAPTTIDALGNDVLCMIFSFIDLVQLIRCSAVCKSWGAVINKLKLLQIQYNKQQQTKSGSSLDAPSFSERLINIQMEQLATERQRLSLQEGAIDIFQWKAHSVVMHPGVVACLSFTDEQLIVSGSSHGSISISDISSDQQVATLDTTSSAAGIKNLCLNPSSYQLFAGSSTGYASCWDLRTLRRVWETRVSPNVIYSMHHLRSDRSTLVVGGIDGALRIVDQDSGEVLSTCIPEQNSTVSNRLAVQNGPIIEKKKAIRLSEDDRILMPNRPPITCLAVGMQKVVTTHGDKCIRVWKFDSK
ncbi:hypothetical protein OROMI_017950 [Orobanche minor]